MSGVLWWPVASVAAVAVLLLSCAVAVGDDDGDVMTGSVVYGPWRARVPAVSEMTMAVPLRAATARAASEMPMPVAVRMLCRRSGFRDGPPC